MKIIIAFILLTLSLHIDAQVVDSSATLREDSLRAQTEDHKFKTWKPDLKDSKDLKIFTSGIYAQTWAILIQGSIGNATPHKVKMAFEGFLVGLAGWTALAVSTNVATVSIIYAALFGIPTAVITIAFIGTAVGIITDENKGRTAIKRMTRFQNSPDKHLINDTLLINASNSVSYFQLPGRIQKAIAGNQKDVGEIYSFMVSAKRYFAIETDKPLDFALSLTVTGQIQNRYDNNYNRQRIQFYDAKGYFIGVRYLN